MINNQSTGFKGKLSVHAKVNYVLVKQSNIVWTAIKATEWHWRTTHKNVRCSNIHQEDMTIGVIRMLLQTDKILNCFYLLHTLDIDDVGSTNCFSTDDNAPQMWVRDRRAKRISNWYNIVLETWLNISHKLMHTVQPVSERLHQLI